MSQATVNVRCNLALDCYRTETVKKRVLYLLKEYNNISEEELNEAETEILCYSKDLKSPKNINDDVNCTLCSKVIENKCAVMLNCGHIFHVECRDQQTVKYKCSICGQKSGKEFDLEGIWLRLMPRLSYTDRYHVLD